MYFLIAKHTGILILRPNQPLSRLLDDLLLIWEASSMEEYQDRIAYIPLT